MKKMLSAMLALMLLFTMAVPALATTNDTEPTENRTVEEILNEYHEKTFAAEMAEETGNPVVYSNRGGSSGKTLEEETVDELRAAGYEAYNVTSSNYDSLEASLKTDFEEMGLDPNGSYIITISGEPSSNAKSIDPPTEDYYDGGGGTGTYFLYTYGNTTYKMRYTTISPSSYYGTNQVDHQDMLKGDDMGEMLWRLADVFVAAGVDAASKPLFIGTILSYCGITPSNIMKDNSAELYLRSTAHWTRSYVEIYNETTGKWVVGSAVDCAGVQTFWDGYYYKESTFEFVAINEIYNYSYYAYRYSDYTWRKQQAVIGYNSSTIIKNYVGDITIYESLSQSFPNATTTTLVEFNCVYS